MQFTVKIPSVSCILHDMDMSILQGTYCMAKMLHHIVFCCCQFMHVVSEEKEARRRKHDFLVQYFRDAFSFFLSRKTLKDKWCVIIKA